MWCGEEEKGEEKWCWEEVEVHFFDVFIFLSSSSLGLRLSNYCP